MAKNQILGLLERAIDALPEPFRVVLVARVVEEMSVEQAAQALGLRPVDGRFPFAGERCKRVTEAVRGRLVVCDKSSHASD